MAIVPALWKGEKAPPPPVPFEIACPCGHSVRGTRQARHQVVPCPGCGANVFVLPQSPFPAVEPAEGTPGVLPRPFRWRVLRWPLLAAALTAIGILAVFLIFFNRFVQSGKLQPGSAGRVEDPVALLASAGEALNHGRLSQADGELRQVSLLAAKNPHALSVVQRRRLTSLHRQVSLLRELLPQSLEEVLQQAADLTDVGEDEWKAVFSDRFAIKAVIFDAELARESPGRYRLGYDVFVRGKPARLELANVALLKSLPLETPQRVVLGLRLAAVTPEAGGWVVRFEPDSGVLLTELGAASLYCLGSEEGLPKVLERQAAWTDLLP